MFTCSYCKKEYEEEYIDDDGDMYCSWKCWISKQKKEVESWSVYR